LHTGVGVDPPEPPAPVEVAAVAVALAPPEPPAPLDPLDASLPVVPVAPAGSAPDPHADSVIPSVVTSSEVMQRAFIIAISWRRLCAPTSTFNNDYRAKTASRRRLTPLHVPYYGRRVNLARATGTLLLASALLASLASGAAAADPVAPPPPAPIMPIARDDDDHDLTGLLAFVTGAVTALVPVAIGATIADRGKDDAAKNVGLIVAGAGVALSPFTAHAVAGEWKRAAAFSAVPVATEIAVSIFLTARPDAVYHGTKITRTTFGILFTTDVFIAALGLVDASFAADRQRERASLPPAKSAGPRLRYASPTVAGGGFGLTLGGTL
jgi:hypothetical protein